MVVRPPAQELGEQIHLAPLLADEIQFISLGKASLVCRKSNPCLLHCRENTSWRVCVVLCFRVLCLGPPKSTAVFEFNKEIGGPTMFFEVANPWAAQFTCDLQFMSLGVHRDWATVILLHVLGVAGNLDQR